MQDITNSVQPTTLSTTNAITSREWGGLALFLVSLLLFRIYNLQIYDVISADGTSYGPIGREFFRTGNFRVFGVISGPVYSFLVGLFDLVLNDIERSLRMVSVVASTASIAPIYLFARGLAGRGGALAAALLAAFLPFLHGMSGIDIIEPTFAFFLLAGTYLLWRACSVSSIPLAAVAGLLTGFAYLSRSEGFITWFAAMVVLVVTAGLKGREEGSRYILRIALPYAAGFLLLFLPYMVYLHAETGIWQLSGKSGLNAQAIREYLGKANVDQKLRLDSGGGFDAGKDESLGRLFRESPELMKQNVINNMKKLPQALSESLTWYLLLAASAAVIVLPWRGEFLLARWLLAAVCSPMVIYLLFFVQPRGLYPYVVFLCIWAGAGLTLPGRFLPEHKRWLVPVVVAGLLGISFLYVDVPRQQPPYDYLQDGGRRADKHIGLRLKSILPKDAVIMTRSGRIGFYSERSYVLPPQESFEAIMAFAAKNRVTHLIVNPQLIGMRPQLEFLFQPVLSPETPFTPPAGLQLAYTGQEPGGLPYLVYRLTNNPIKAAP